MSEIKIPNYFDDDLKDVILALKDEIEQIKEQLKTVNSLLADKDIVDPLEKRYIERTRRRDWWD